MATNIEWVKGGDGECGATWNPLAGCKEISPGCINCYAAKMAKRLEAMRQAKYAGTTRTLPNGKVVWTGKINLDESALSIPLKRKKPTTYFVNSMSDLFHEDVPDEFIDKVFAAMALCPQHTFQVLTKRAERMAAYLADADLRIVIESVNMQTPETRMQNQAGIDGWWPLQNVWLGVSVEDQQRANERIPHLLRTPAAVRFLSCEPLLEGVTPLGLDGIHWVIVGGESGPGARPCHPDWVRSIRDQCVAAGVPFFFKQWGEWAVGECVPGGDLGGDMRAGRADFVHREPHTVEEGLKRSVWPGSVIMLRVGKKAAGRLLDGREWSEMPERKAVTT